MENKMYQVSTLQALALGYSRAVITAGELLQEGNTGLGTFEDVNGEMIVMDGHCFRADQNGNVTVVPQETGIPFAAVATLHGEQQFLLKVYLDERDLRDEEWHDLKPNGFTEPRIIHDFPLRELKVVLHVRRRRWLAEDGGNVILNRIPLAAEGTGYSAEFAAFLKEALGYVPGDGPFRWSLLQDMRE